MKSSNKGKDFCVFALPGLFCFLAVVMVPFIYGIYLTLTDWNGVSSVKNFVGLSNFAAVMRDIWQFVFSRVFVSIGETTGWSLFEISWLSTPNKAFAALVLVSVWQLAGYMILIYVAGFMGLSEDVLEAASIDGASGWVKMKNIILPLMMSSVTICLFLTLSRAFMVYDVNLSLTGGAPYGTTEMAAMHVYEKAFTSRQFGVGQAEAFILFIIVACISGIQVYTTKKREVEA